MNISLIIIGDEVLLGQVTDTNGSTIAKLLYSEGWEIRKKWTVADEDLEIRLALEEASHQSDIIIMTGGLGPTKDDVTKTAIAKFMHQKLVFSEQNKLHIIKMLEKRKINVTDNHLQQCYLPENATLLDNQMGTALGMQIKHNGKLYFAMPGVPYEMEFIMKSGIIPKLKTLTSEVSLFHQIIHTVGMGETEIAEIIEPKLEQMPEYISLAYLPSQGQVKLRLTAKHHNIQLIQQQIEIYRQIIADCLPDKIIGFGQTSLEDKIGKLLQEKQMSLSTAESCTGGYVAHKITTVPGSSAYFIGSLVAYQNEIKQQQLKVSEDILSRYGAVSEECVQAMVIGACHLFNTDFAIATSGIAGPDGGSMEKPVGTVWIACGNQDKLHSKKFHFFRDRIRNIEAATTFSLIEFWKYLRSNY